MKKKIKNDAGTFEVIINFQNAVEKVLITVEKLPKSKTTYKSYVFTLDNLVMGVAHVERELELKGEQARQKNQEFQEKYKQQLELLETLGYE